MDASYAERDAANQKPSESKSRLRCERIMPAHLPTCPPAHLPTCPPAYLPTCLSGHRRLVGGLSSKALLRFVLDGNTIAREERIDMKRRVRDVIQASDGSILVITDDKAGELLRLSPLRETR